MPWRHLMLLPWLLSLIVALERAIIRGGINSHVLHRWLLITLHTLWLKCWSLCWKSRRSKSLGLRVHLLGLSVIWFERHSWRLHWWSRHLHLGYLLLRSIRLWDKLLELLSSRWSCSFGRERIIWFKLHGWWIHGLWRRFGRDLLNVSILSITDLARSPSAVESSRLTWLRLICWLELFGHLHLSRSSLCYWLLFTFELKHVPPHIVYQPDSVLFFLFNVPALD